MKSARLRKTLIFSLTYAPFVGGAELAIQEITNRIPDMQFDMVTLRFDRSLPRMEKIGNVTVYRLGFGGSKPVMADLMKFPLTLNKYLFPFLAFWKAMLLHRKNRYDAVWAMMANYAGFAALFFKILHRDVPFLLTLQEGDPIEYIKARVRFVYPLFARIFIAADFVQVISTYLGKWARDMGFVGPLEIIPNGADIAHFSREYPTEELAALKKKLGKGENDVYLITTSRLVKKNAVNDVIKALPLLPENVKFLVLGIGPDETMLKDLAQELGVEKRVLFVGQVGHADMPRYLHISDIFIRPSLSEGMGSSFVEAMGAGLPIIATPVGGIVDFLKDGETGLMCEVRNPQSIADAVTRLCADHNLKNTLAANARELVQKKYDWNSIARDMREKVFMKLGHPRVLVATGIFPPDIGGPATYSKILSNRLPEHGIAADVLSFGTVRGLPKVLRHCAYFMRVLRMGRRADIIFAQDPVSVGLPTMLAAKLLRKKFVLKVVGDYAWEQGMQRFGVSDMLDDFISEYAKYPWQVRMLKRIQAYVATRADAVIVPSAYLKDIVARWGVSDAKVHVVYNAVNPVHVTESKDALRSELQLKGTVILSAGRLVPWKGFTLLIDSMPEILMHIPDAVLMIVGDGPDKQNLKEKIEKLAIADKITITGKMPHNKLLALLKASDLFVLNTGYEGFSHQILEAMAVGTPVITTRVGGNAEIITSGENGLLVPYNDEGTLVNAIVKLLQDTSLARTFAARARETAQLFSEERMIRETVSILKRL